MKKVILSFAILLIAAFTVNAQIGIRGGLGFANVKYTNGAVDVNPDSKLGLSVGVSKEIKVIGKFIKLVPELQFDVKGTQGIDLDILQVGVSHNYVGLGLGAKVKIPLLPVYALAQPYYQYLLGGQTVVTDANGDVTKSDLPDGYFDDVKRSEFGVNLGLGTQFTLGPVGLFLEARYAVPMTKLEEAKDAASYDLKNKYFTVSLGFLFGGN